MDLIPLSFDAPIRWQRYQPSAGAVEAGRQGGEGVLKSNVNQLPP